ncbi:SDR family NAD(P)-dependent oxidoreductase [Lentzea sp. NPDC051208]|uniref:SDR family NAD(P)-dependent oxidoreductase n=1 Tax=Lentzea sp. NPDC051208 TaxID=3154642 RepID=UPI00341838B2
MSTARAAAVITGGTGGMGLATARLMGHDHRIVLADLDRTHLDDAVRELAVAGVEAVGVLCDITGKASVEQLFQHAESAFRLAEQRPDDFELCSHSARAKHPAI